jgi:hypothetical protein
MQLARRLLQVGFGKSSNHAGADLSSLGYGIFIAYTAVYIASFLVWTWTNPEGFFIVEPLRMIRYWLEHPYSVPVLREVVVTHVSPVAWTMPGP